jgi:hypothetical protein
MEMLMSDIPVLRLGRQFLPDFYRPENIHSELS